MDSHTTKTPMALDEVLFREKVLLWSLQAICLGLFVRLFYPVGVWLATQLQSADNRIHIAAGLGLLGLLLRSAIAHWPLQLPQFYRNRSAFLLFVVAVLIYLLNEYITAIHIFSASAMILALYAASGFYLSIKSWRRLFLPMGLLMALLPFEGYLDIYFGFPLRLYTAQAAGSLLNGFVSMPLSPEAILMVENRAALVDLECSGLKGLWAGIIFYFALSWIEQKTVGLRWFYTLLLYFSCLILFNIIRIVILVTVDLIFHLPELASVLHVPLGLMGFGVSCGVAWLVLAGQQPPLQLPMPRAHAPPIFRPPSSQLICLLCFLLAAMWLYTPKPKMETSRVFSAITLPPELHTTPLPLSQYESGFFEHNLAQAKKFQFTLGALNGSILFVRSAYWKSQHDPRNCYHANGHSVDFEQTWLLPEAKTVKHLVLDSRRYSALYWFQSANHHTSDFASRVMWGWRDIEADWVMVSVLFDTQINMEQIGELFAIIDHSLGKALSVPVMELNEGKN